MQWIKAFSEMDDNDILPPSGCDVFIRYDEGRDKHTGDRKFIIELIQNGWQDVEWLDELINMS